MCSIVAPGSLDSVRDGDVVLLEEARVSGKDLRAGDGRFQPHAGLGLKCIDGQEREPALLSGAEDGARQRMLGALLCRCGELSSRSSDHPAAGATATTLGLPSVSVPVLSSRTVSTWASLSSASPPLNRTPSCAPRPMATVKAAGTARPIAQGQAITSTAMATANPRLTSKNDQITKVAIASAMIAGTKMALTRSASCCMGAREDCACSTSRRICPRRLSAPTAVARYSMAPS